MLCIHNIYGSATCSVSVVDMSFGNIDIYENVANTTGSVTVVCYNNGDTETEVSYLVKFSKVNSVLKNNNYVINYNIYIDSSYMKQLGDGNANTAVITNKYKLLPMSNRSDNFPIYGKLIGNYYIVAGAYSDKILITLEYWYGVNHEYLYDVSYFLDNFLLIWEYETLVLLIVTGTSIFNKMLKFSKLELSIL